MVKKTEEKQAKENKEKKDNNPKKLERQTTIIVTTMVVLIISVFLVNWIVQERKEFEHNGLSFYKEREGSVTYYKSLLGYVSATGQEIPFILKLRNDPRDLEEIPVKGNIQLKEEAILSISPEIAECPKTYITLIDFSRTLKAFSTTASAATTDETYAKENNISLVDCRNSLDKTVIIMKKGNKTEISQEQVIFKNCYIMEIADCQVQESFEKFMLSYIGNSIVK